MQKSIMEMVINLTPRKMMHVKVATNPIDVALDCLTEPPPQPNIFHFGEYCRA